MRNSSRRSTGHVPHIWRREIGVSSPLFFERSFTSSEALIRRLDCYQTLEGHNTRIYTIRFNPTGSLLISGAGDANVKIWNWLDGKLKFQYPHGHQERVMDAQFLPFTNDRKILTSSDGPVKLHEIADDSLVTTRVLGRHVGSVPQLAIEPGSPHIFYSCGEDGFVKRFDLRTPSPTNLFSCISFSGSGLPVQLKCVVLDPRDLNCFAIGGFDQFVRLFDVRMYQWDASTHIDRPVTTYCPRHLLDSLDNHITGLAYSNKSELLVSYDCEQIYLFNKGMDIGPDPTTVSEEHLLNLVQPRSYSGHRNTLPVKPVCFLGPREEYIVSGSECSNIFIWRKKDSKLLRKMVGGPSSVQCVATYPNTLFFASGGHDRNVRIWAPIGEEPERDPEPEVSFAEKCGKLMHDVQYFLTSTCRRVFFDEY
ncbi:WD40 repeat protein [Dioscorea alata]|uniref:WD40 repeat protein n=1 Tax=Dioscorea alata TaxID=55571 RepID=A0ACB7VTA7_DIOAL|nr:WD40 repeat protein [Dioscorea alata]